MSVEDHLRRAVLYALGYKCAFWTSIDRLTDVCERAGWLMESVGLTARRHVPAVSQLCRAAGAGNRRDDRRRGSASARRANCENGEIEQAVERD